MQKTLLLIGATGLVGSQLLKLALEDERFKEVKIFVRRSSGLTHVKLKEFIVDFEGLNDWKDLLEGDILISALGTTLKEVGSLNAQKVIDHDYQLRVAQAAKINHVNSFTLISASGASSKSLFGYSRMKGDLERAISKLGFKKTTILRPGLLRGQRVQKRFIENNLGKVLSLLPIIPGLEMMSPVDGKQVAQVALEHSLNENEGMNILEAKEILGFIK